MRQDGEERPAAGRVVRDSGVMQTHGLAKFRKGLCLLGRPAVAGVARCAGLHVPLGREEATAGSQDPADFVEPAPQVRPMVHRRKRPSDVQRVIRQREGLGRTLLPCHRSTVVISAGDTQHDIRGSTPTTVARRSAASRAATPGPHPISTTRDPGPRSVSLMASSASPVLPDRMLSAAMSPAIPEKPRWWPWWLGARPESFAGVVTRGA